MSRQSIPGSVRPNAGRILLSLVMVAALTAAAAAGPPFVTDDPEPTDYGHFENYFYSTATEMDGKSAGTAFGVEVNYGALPDVQISGAIPFDYEPGPEAGTHYDLGAAEFGVKYRFIEEDEDGWRPQVSFYPSIDLPMHKTIDDSNTREYFPVWAQKSVGDWTTFGGGGYWNNPGQGNRDYWFAGWALLRRVLPDLQIGAEIFHQTSSLIGVKGSTGYNVGELFDINDNLHIVGSAGSGLTNVTGTNQFSYYLALEWTT